MTIPDYEDWSEQQRSFAGLAVFYTGTIIVSGLDRPERYEGGFISGNTFDVLGVQPFMGRGFTVEDARPGADGVMLLATPRGRTGSAVIPPSSGASCA